MGLFDNKSKFSIKKEYKISEESALNSLHKLFELYDFDIDGETDKDIKKAKISTAENLLEYFRLGHIELKENSVVIIQNLKHPQGEVGQIEYAEFKGRHKRATDSFKQDEFIGKSFALLGSVSGLGVDAFDALGKYDTKVAEAIGALFLL